MPLLGEGGVEAYPVGCTNREEALRMKAYFFEVMEYDFTHDEADPVESFQGTTRRFHQSDARIRIQTAPARTSKSYSTAAEVVAGVMPTEPRMSSLTYIVGVDYKTNKEFEYCWQHLVERRERWQGIYKVARAVNNPSQGNMIIVLDVGTNAAGDRCTATLCGKSSTNERSLQGEALSYTVLSEAAEHEARIWQKYLSPRTWKAIFPTTPKAKAEWIREMSAEGERSPELRIESFHMSRYANPHYDHEAFERERAMAASRAESGCWEDDPYFMEQFMGAWVYYTGQVLPFRSHHIVDLDESWLDASDLFVSCDYGYEDACVMLFWALLPNGVLLLFDELYDRHLDTETYIDRGIEILEARNRSVKHLRYACGDPRQPQVEHYLHRFGFPVARIHKNRQSDRALGMRRLVDLLSVDPDTGHPRLFVASHCRKTIAEWEQLHYREGHRNEYGTGAFGKCSDHAFDAARYFVTTMPEPRRAVEGPDWVKLHRRKLRERRFAQHPRASSLGLGRWASTGVSPYA